MMTSEMTPAAAMTPASVAFASLTSFLEKQSDPKVKTASTARAKEAAKSIVAQAMKAPRTNDKKIAAQKLFEANKDAGNGEIATLISKELEITYANAYYYVSRVFKRSI